MKKFAKVTAIVSLVLVILALVFITVGTVGGGASVLRFMALNGDLNFGPEDYYSDRHGINITYSVNDGLFDEDYDIVVADSFVTDTKGESVDSLVLSIGGGDIDIMQGDKDYWEVKVDGFGKFQSYVKEGTLYVVGDQNGVNIEAGDVTVLAPKAGESLSKVFINLGAGDMYVDYLTADYMDVSVGAGALEFDEVNVRDMEISVGAGEILVQDGTIGDLSASVGMGAIEIEAEITGDIDGDVAMGELVICVKGSDEKSHNYEVSCGAGEVRVGSRAYAGVAVSTDLNNGASSTYELDCVFGAIQITFRQ